MPLAESEIVKGAIAYFDVSVLHADEEVIVTGDPVVRDTLTGNQFVCYDAGGGLAFWAPLTATWRKERLRIESSWVENGYGPLAEGKVFLQDGKNTYSGPVKTFISAAALEEPIVGARPTVREIGVGKIVAVVRQRGGQVRDAA